ncbi:ATP-binding protein [Haliangium sp.]|uniref:ATP-binding protein n=1 Tax=Haliangium sp. TaxID=2663208 RepID=UPI003D0DD584
MTQHTASTSPRPKIPLRRWVQRAYFRAALVPLLLVEVVIIAIYLLANSSATQENQAAIEALAKDELQRIAHREANLVDKQLTAIAQTTELFRRQTDQALTTPLDPGPDERARYVYSDDGVVYYTNRDDGGAALFYSGIVPVGEAERDKALRTAQLDPIMRDIADTNPLVVQIYLNTFDSLNRIYPYFDVLEVFPKRMNIPSFNFYYEADAAHNPGRGVVWTDVYIDPAGQGWMTSCIAPVYEDDFLAGVVGLDVTVATIISSVLDLEIPWEGYGMLVGKDGTIMALPEAGEADWRLTELTAHEYTEKIAAETLKPDEFNLFKRPDLSPLAQSIAKAPAGLTRFPMGDHKLVAWAEIAQTGWKLMVVVPEANIFAHANQLGDRLFRLGTWMIGGLVAFYAVFLLLIARRSNNMAASISRPLEEVDELVDRIGRGEYEQAAPTFPVAELQQTAIGLVEMGRQLGASAEGLRQARLEAEQARDQALEASQLKSEFLASVSHEIRTPMNGVLGMLDLLLETQLDDEQRDFAATSRESGEALLQIINDILDFSKIEAGKLELHEARFAPVDVVERAADVLAPRARQKRISLMTFVDPQVPHEITGDPGRLRQVLLNLMGNAVKFTATGGEVSVRVTMDPHAADDGTHCLCFAVSDTGIGIPERAQGRLFQPFTQVDGSATRGHGGTGLGLSISKHLVELMGGNIGFRSAEGVGSTFWFRVPLGDESEGDGEHPEDTTERPVTHSGLAAAPILAGLQVMLVEPSSAGRDILRDYLQAWRVDVTAVASAGDAFAHLRRARADGTPFHCILAGLSPGGDEDALLVRALRRDQGLGRLPRVLLAELDDDEREAHARTHGFEYHLAKPVHRERLFDCLSELADARALATTSIDANADANADADADADAAPRASARTAGARVPSPPPDDDFSGRILLAEDNDTNRKVALNRLRRMGYRVDVAENGRVAVDMALTGHYELILMDIQMPVLDGLEATRTIRAAEAERGHRSAIVAVTANAMEGDRERFLAEGLDDYLSKPYDPTALDELVRRWAAAPDSNGGPNAHKDR